MNYRDMARIAADPSAVRERARIVKALLGERTTPWQARFLDRMARFEGPGLLPMDDREVLHQLTGKASRRKEKAGYRAAVLVERLWRLRHDASEEDEEFLNDLMADGADVAPTENQWRKLFAVARQLGEIDHYVA
ncbi:MAG: hypothetical protein AAFZ01_10250 [Pseudomonadota bacterium]